MEIFQKYFFISEGLSCLATCDATDTGVDQNILKSDGALCRPPWLADKEKLGFRWSKNAKITLETISFWQIISTSIFKFSAFLYTMKVCQ